MNTSVDRVVRWSFASILISVLILGACAQIPSTPTVDIMPSPMETPTGPQDMQIAASNIERQTAPAAPQGDLETLVTGNTTFGLDLFKILRESDANLFYSPYSISLALAMTYAGARGETESQMAETLHFTLMQDRLHPAFNALDLALASRAESGSLGEPGFQLNIANSIWGQRDYTFLQGFLDTLAANYGAGLRLVDFVADAEGARQMINQWVEEQTQNRIQNLIPEGVLNELTRLVLANAIYFKANWQNPFEKDLTRPGSFTLLNGDAVEIPMMSFSEAARVNYLQGEGFQALELPYQRNQVGMLILLPDDGEFATLAEQLDAAQLDQIVTGLRPTTAMLTMPLFSIESSLEMNDLLSRMGMPDAFDPAKADFSGMDGTTLLYISKILHKAFVSVDEEGTEAAAATVVVVAVESITEPEIEVTVDRPFLFLIRDLQTGTVLFIGQVLDPSA